MTEETYTHTTTCPNCGNPQIYRIPKGTSVSSFMAGQTCSNCGCRMAGAEFRYGDGHGMITMVAKSDDEPGKVEL